MSRVSWRVLAPSLLLLCSCGSTSDEPEETAGGVCDVVGCPASCASLRVESCDVRQPDCQADVFASVQCVRGGSGAMPAISMMNEGEYADYLQQEIQESVPDDPQLQQEWETILWQFDLLEEGISVADAAVETMTEVVGGFYSEETKDVTIVDRGSPLEETMFMVMLAHEFVHALQDREINLADIDGELMETDEYVAKITLVEGEARLYEWLVTAFMFELSLDELGLDDLLAQDLKGMRRRTLMSESPVLDAIIGLPYPLGASYLHDVWLQAGNAGVRSQYQEHPPTSLGWMVGLEQNRSQTAGWAEPLDCQSPIGPTGFEERETDGLGAVVLFAFIGSSLATGPVLPTEAAWQQARGWRGDRIVLYANAATSEVAAAWSIRFSSSDAAAQFAAQAQAAAGAWATVVLGNEVHLLVSNNPVILTSWIPSFEASCG